MDGTSGKGTAVTADAEARAGTRAGERPHEPATSPLMEEVNPGHPLREAIETADAERQAGSFGRPGRAMNRRSPFFIGMTGAAGVAVTYGLVELLLRARSVLILLVPRIIGHTVKVPALAGMIAVVLGGVLLGIIGALIAMPVAAAIGLILNEVTFRRLDNS